ncbi:MAG TPA: DUF2970 domain-containing protein [Burkholderiales bacterium]|jgi:hypothetical protein|nr:DUF2970 domain-containing protein [Burkholderiales bacterium]
MAGERGARPSPLRAFKAVLWAFLGIRKGAASERDLATLRPWQVVLAGVIGAALFVTAIVTLVRIITG